MGQAAHREQMVGRCNLGQARDTLRLTETRPAAVRASCCTPPMRLLKIRRHAYEKSSNRLQAAGTPLWFGRLTSATLGTASTPKTPSGAKSVAQSVRDLVDDHVRMVASSRMTPTSPPSTTCTGARHRRAAGPLPQTPATPRCSADGTWSRSPEHLARTACRRVLMREQEATGSVEEGRLFADPSNIFQLLPTSLHLQRGTAGSEVSMCPSTLEGLGLEADSPSASE